MGNPYDDMGSMTADTDGAGYNKKGTLSSNQTITLTNPGWWKIHGSVDFYVYGPHIGTCTATTNSQFWAADNEILLCCKRSSMRVAIRAVSGTGTYHMNWLRGV